MKIRVQETTYRGRPIIRLFDEDVAPEYKDYPLLTLGLRKAKAVMSIFGEIENFINKHGEQNGKIHSNS